MEYNLKKVLKNLFINLIITFVIAFIINYLELIQINMVGLRILLIRLILYIFW